MSKRTFNLQGQQDHGQSSSDPAMGEFTHQQLDVLEAAVTTFGIKGVFDIITEATDNAKNTTHRGMFESLRNQVMDALAENKDRFNKADEVYNDARASTIKGNFSQNNRPTFADQVALDRKNYNPSLTR